MIQRLTLGIGYICLGVILIVYYIGTMIVSGTIPNYLYWSGSYIESISDAFMVIPILLSIISIAIGWIVYSLREKSIVMGATAFFTILWVLSLILNVLNITLKTSNEIYGYLCRIFFSISIVFQMISITQLYYITKSFGFVSFPLVILSFMMIGLVVNSIIMAILSIAVIALLFIALGISIIYVKKRFLAVMPPPP